MGISPEEVFELSAITPWFTKQMMHILAMESEVQNSDENLDAKTLKDLKKSGFSDKHIAFLKNTSQEGIFKMRQEHNLTPTYKAVDTCSGEFNAVTPYFYSTYANENEAKVCP